MIWRKVRLVPNFTFTEEIDHIAFLAKIEDFLSNWVSKDITRGLGEIDLEPEDEDEDGDEDADVPRSKGTYLKQLVSSLTTPVKAPLDNISTAF